MTGSIRRRSRRVERSVRRTNWRWSPRTRCPERRKGCFAAPGRFGIGWHTPASVHYGTADQIRRHRQDALNAAYTQHPDRFIRRPRAPQLPEEAWINQPTAEAQTVSIDLTDSGSPADPGRHERQLGRPSPLASMVQHRYQAPRTLRVASRWPAATLDPWHRCWWRALEGGRQEKRWHCNYQSGRSWW